jgi:3-oxoacyl-[acyl-carrier-protein] synthase-3
MRNSAGILGIGSSLPKNVVTNFDLEKLVDTSDEWIRTRTGIKERRIAEEGEYLSTFMTEAARKALLRAEMDAKDVDIIICATVTPDHPLPATGCFVQANLGAKNAAAFDISAACSGFIYGLSIADKFIRLGEARRVLVIGGEVLSRVIDWNDRGTCVIFADGAGAAVVGEVPRPRGILATRIRSDGEFADFLLIPAGGTRMPASAETVEKNLHSVKMKGNELFKVAVRAMADVALEVLREADIKTDEIRVLIPHQANQRITDAVTSRLKLTKEKVYSNIGWIGNTSSGSIPIALDELFGQGRIKEGDLVLLTAFGGGVTWGASLIRW